MHSTDSAWSIPTFTSYGSLWQYQDCMLNRMEVHTCVWVGWDTPHQLDIVISNACQQTSVLSIKYGSSFYWDMMSELDWLILDKDQMNTVTS